MSSFGCASEVEQCRDVASVCGYSREEFICQAMKLLPDGPLWRRESCNFSEFFQSIASTYYDQFQRTCALTTEANPCTSDVYLEEWASIWGGLCAALPEDPEELRDEICRLIQSQGFLTKEIIEAEVTAAGYEVVSCEVDTTRSSEVVRPLWGRIPGVYVPGYPSCSNLSPDSCADQFSGTPCANEFIAACCPAEEEQAPVDPPQVQCEATPAYSFCARMGGVGGGEFGAGYSPLESPWTIRVVVSANSPALADLGCQISLSQYPNYPGFPPALKCLPDLNTATFCAIEALRPEHLNIVINMECPY